MKVHVSVTQEDIDNGVQQDCHFCPIARALAREIGPNIAVTARVATYRENEYRLWAAALPPHAQRFISAFDGVYGSDRSTVKPLEFDLEFK